MFALNSVIIMSLLNEQKWRKTHWKGLSLSDYPYAHAQGRCFAKQNKLHSPKSYVLSSYSGYLYTYPSGFKFSATVFGWAQIKLFFAALQTFQILNKLIERCWCGARKVSFVFIFFKTFINFRRLLFWRDRAVLAYCLSQKIVRYGNFGSQAFKLQFTSLICIKLHIRLIKKD